MTEFDFKGALEVLKKLDPQHSMEIGHEEFERQTLDRAIFVILHYEKLCALLNLAARVQSGELVVVPRELTVGMQDAARKVANEGAQYRAAIAAAPKHDWSE